MQFNKYIHTHTLTDILQTDIHSYIRRNIRSGYAVMCNLLNIYSYIPYSYIHIYILTYIQTRMTGPDCADMCNFIYIHTYILTYIYIHTYPFVAFDQRFS